MHGMRHAAGASVQPAGRPAQHACQAGQPTAPAAQPLGPGAEGAEENGLGDRKIWAQGDEPASVYWVVLVIEHWLNICAWQCTPPRI